MGLGTITDSKISSRCAVLAGDRTYFIKDQQLKKQLLNVDLSALTHGTKDSSIGSNKRAEKIEQRFLMRTLATEERNASNGPRGYSLLDKAN